jgi:uncharacterized membrane protein YdbT with pleckstrin-like domain
MYSSFRRFCERLLRIPHDPAPPPGDEAATKIFRAGANFYKYLICLWALKTGVVMLIVCGPLSVPLIIGAATLASEGKRSGWLLLLIPALFFAVAIAVRLFALAVVRLDFEKRWYVVTDRSLRIREGVVTVNEMTVNFANIQNLSISQGPIQRLLGISDLQVDTAGGGGVTREQHASRNLHVARFRGINNANEVRELIQTRLRHLKDAGIGDPEQLGAATPASAASVLGGAEVSEALGQILAEASALRRCLKASA